MEEIEVPTEHLHEAIQEKAGEAAKENESNWVMYVAISTALVAVFAAMAALFAGHHSNEALIEQIKASDQWAYYQAKGIKADIKALAVNGNSDSMEKYKKEQADIKEQAEAEEKLSAFHLSQHVTLARSVTLFQIAIAISAISILTRKKLLWYIGLLFSLGGIIFFLLGML
ncbi:MAG: putative transrane protein [Chitinophagaceae bacterium]|nr:putative transrane protein [Chitinophagaceae bacterium]